MATITNANRTVVIEDGKIAEEGTHATLLAITDGRYRQLHSMQAANQIIETSKVSL